jgi:hypothetical protein
LTVQDGKAVTSLAPLAGLKNLKEITIHGNQKGLSLKPLSAMRRLEQVTIWGPAVDMDALNSCESLATLHVGGCDKAPPLDGARKLVHLSIALCPSRIA